MKLLSITIPCYNSQDYMERCIHSLLPGGDDVEILVVDDGSRDMTPEIADAYVVPHCPAGVFLPGLPARRVSRPAGHPASYASSAAIRIAGMTARSWVWKSV